MRASERVERQAQHTQVKRALPPIAMDSSRVNAEPSQRRAEPSQRQLGSVRRPLDECDFRLAFACLARPKLAASQQSACQIAAPTIRLNQSIGANRSNYVACNSSCSGDSRASRGFRSFRAIRSFRGFRGSRALRADASTRRPPQDCSDAWCGMRSASASASRELDSTRWAPFCRAEAEAEAARRRARSLLLPLAGSFCHSIIGIRLIPMIEGRGTRAN